MKSRFLYFAYGSNMSSSRLQARTPSARWIATACLPGYVMAFAKPGMDGSAKCGIWRAEGETVHGVVFEIDDRERAILDRCEGLGFAYDAEWIRVQTAEGDTIQALTYVPRQRVSELLPTEEYLNHVLTGAREFELPEAYIAELARQTSLVLE